MFAEADYPFRVRTIIYPHASHLFGTNPPESWKKAFPAEKKWPAECNEARKDCFDQEFQFLDLYNNIPSCLEPWFRMKGVFFLSESEFIT